MAQFFVSTDSTCDLFAEEREQLKIGYVPLINTIGSDNDIYFMPDEFQTQQEYVDFFNLMRKGISIKTSMISPEKHKEYFTQLAKNGVKDCIHFCISYGLARTCEIVTEAAALVKKEYPDFNLIACEAHSATVGQGILVKMACKCRDSGMSLLETLSYINGQKNKLQHFIMVDDLYHLKKGGRISGAAAAVGTLLQLKVIIEFDKDGKLVVTNKISGRHRAIEHIVARFESFTHPTEYYPTIVHCDNLPLAELLYEKLHERYGIQPQIRIMGPTIGCHVGPNGVAFAFLSEQEKV